MSSSCSLPSNPSMAIAAAPLPGVHDCSCCSACCSTISAVSLQQVRVTWLTLQNKGDLAEACQACNLDLTLGRHQYMRGKVGIEKQKWSRHMRKQVAPEKQERSLLQASLKMHSLSARCHQARVRTTSVHAATRQECARPQCTLPPGKGAHDLSARCHQARVRTTSVHAATRQECARPQCTLPPGKGVHDLSARCHQARVRTTSVHAATGQRALTILTAEACCIPKQAQSWSVHACAEAQLMDFSISKAKNCQGCAQVGHQRRQALLMAHTRTVCWCMWGTSARTHIRFPS